MPAFKMCSASTAPGISHQTKGTPLMQPLNPPCLSTPLAQLLSSAVKCQLRAPAGHGLNAGSLQQAALEALEQFSPLEFNALNRRAAPEHHFRVPVPSKAFICPSDVCGGLRQPERLDRKEMPGAKCTIAVFHLHSMPSETGPACLCDAKGPRGSAGCFLGRYPGSKFLSGVTKPSCPLSPLILLEQLVG